VTSERTPHQPPRSAFDGDELIAYERVVARQKAYNYGSDFLANIPEEHRDLVMACMSPAGDEADPDDRVQAYMGAMLNSPLFMSTISELGVVGRTRGERGDSYAHADREWVDMVLGAELGCWSVVYLHMGDAVAVGVRPAAIRAVLEGREHELSAEESLKANFIRQIARGTVTARSYEAVADLLGRRGAVEYSAFVGFLLMTLRLIQTFDAQSGFNQDMCLDLIGRIESHAVGLPDPKARVPALADPVAAR
jgi:hypothetical protein